MSCDIRIAAESAKFGFPETDVGLTITTAGTKLLAQIVGLGKAKELVFTGDFIDAHEAMAIGLANKVVPDEILLDESMEKNRLWHSNSPESPSTRDCTRVSSKHWKWKPAIF